MSCTNANNDQTPRTCTLGSAACACPACWDREVEAMEREKMRYDMHDVWGDDSDIDPPFDYSTPEDDSDRNGGGDYRKGYEPPEVQ